MGAILSCFHVSNGEGNPSSSNSCSIGCCSPKCFIQKFFNKRKNLAPRQETTSVSSNIQDGTSSNSEVVENYSSNERRLGRSEHSQDESAILLPPQNTNVAPRQETISDSSNNQDNASSNSEVVDNYSSNGSRLDRSEYSEDERSKLLLKQQANAAPSQETISTLSTNQDAASLSSEVVDNCASNGSRVDISERSEDESSLLLVDLQAELSIERDPVLQILDSEFGQKDETLTPRCSSSVKKVSQELGKGFAYTFPLPYDEADEDVCPTCLEEYDEENPKIIAKCNHHFHLSCIYEWMERSSTCPVCREVMLFDE